MTILTKEDEKIINEWKHIKQNREFIDNIKKSEVEVNLFPRHVKIEIPLCTSNSLPKKLKQYKERLKKKLSEIALKNKYALIEEKCYLYVTFKKRDEGDIDNLLKPFLDAVGGEGKEEDGVLLKDDSGIIGVKANSVETSDNEKEGVSFTLIPAYELKIDSVHEIKTEKGLGRLNALRKKYSKSLGDETKLTEWKNAMQRIKTNYGVFYDNAEGNLPGVKYYGKSYGKEIKYKPEPGFDWKSKQYKTVKGVMIYERSGCWWINKWAE